MWKEDSKAYSAFAFSCARISEKSARNNTWDDKRYKQKLKGVIYRLLAELTQYLRGHNGICDVVGTALPEQRGKLDLVDQKSPDLRTY